MLNQHVVDDKTHPTEQPNALELFVYSADPCRMDSVCEASFLALSRLWGLRKFLPAHALGTRRIKDSTQSDLLCMCVVGGQAAQGHRAAVSGHGGNKRGCESADEAPGSQLPAPLGHELDTGMLTGKEVVWERGDTEGLLGHLPSSVVWLQGGKKGEK